MSGKNIFTETGRINLTSYMLLVVLARSKETTGPFDTQVGGLEKLKTSALTWTTVSNLLGCGKFNGYGAHKKDLSPSQ